MAETGGSPVPAGLAETRERTIQALCEHFAQDAITLDEFERRIDLAHRATTGADLVRLTLDLPALAASAGPAQAQVPAPASSSPVPVISSDRVRERQLMVAIMGGSSRRGRWIPPRHLIVGALWGGADLDFREAHFGPGVTEVTVVALMGGANIVVPPGLPVECGGVAIMGGFDQVEDMPGAAAPGAPTLRVNGLVLMGGVAVDVRLPGETQSEAKRRRKQERKRLRGSC